MKSADEIKEAMHSNSLVLDSPAEHTRRVYEQSTWMRIFDVLIHAETEDFNDYAKAGIESALRFALNES